ncbi:MAG: serine hydrolase [Edaphobacter sp.]
MQQQYDFSTVSAAIDQAIAAKKLPGAVVLINHGGKTVFEHAYGNRSLEPAIEPMTEDTIFDMASLTKCLVTATAVMQLYEQHKLAFDDPVAKYLPAFAANGKEKVTIRELLTHYSGLPEDVSLKDDWGLATPDKAEGIRRAMNATLYGPPGVTFKYSDINYITLGALVEALSGQPLEAYAREHIFVPLKMTHTRYLPASALIPEIAPTAYDDQGDATTNPDFNKMLRGTVHDPSTRRMGGVAGHAGVFSTAGDVALFAQALLDRLAGRPSDFPLHEATLKLMTRPEQPSTAAGGATIFTPDGKPATGVAARGFGWDINSAFSRPRGEVFPIGSFGHTGFTGTSLWMDPESNTFVVILANSVHPREAAPISPLRGQIATGAAEALHLYGPCPAHTICDPTVISSSAAIDSENASTHRVVKPEDNASNLTLTGIDVLEATHFAALDEAAKRHGGHLRLGLLTNQTGLDRDGHRTIDILLHSLPEVELKTLFSPEHGLLGVKDTIKIGNDVDFATRLPVISLYGVKPEQRRPSQESLKDLDAVVIDLQDVGVRFYTYEAVVGYFLEAAAQAHIEVILLDRPNPIGGLAVEGPVSDVGAESYNNYMPMPVRNGMTLGELALYFNSERHIASSTSPNILVPIRAQLTVVAMKNWRRTYFFDDTGLKWTNPSPNLRSPAAATLYPAVGLTEMTNISVGRGSDKPYEHIGAPFINAQELADYLTARRIPGVSFAPTSFAVAEDANRYPSHGKTIPGIAFTVTDRDALDSPELGIELLSALHRLYPDFLLSKAAYLVTNVDTMRALENNDDPRKIAGAWKADLDAFRQRRQTYLLYQ